MVVAAARDVTHTFASGRLLRRLESIDRKRSADDTAHAKYAAVITSRSAFEEATRQILAVG